MAKDPAILFYSSDFLTGTMLMSNEQVGKYIRLLCLQHQKDLLSEKDMLKICITYDEDIWCKFVKCDEGFYNQRMKDEKQKRFDYSESRRNNRKRKESEKDMLNISNTYVKHMENENENENENINTDRNINKSIVKKEKEIESTIYKSFIAEYDLFFNSYFGFKPNYTTADFKAVKLLIKYFNQNTEGDEQKSLNAWRIILKNWNYLSDFYKQKSTLREINSNITKILIEIKSNQKKESAPIGNINKQYHDLIERIKKNG
tara:strand:- start:427 stop:1206 length:780 start_codon:yes stop_codon:yes gene_type:complete